MVAQKIPQERIEALGPAEHLIQTLTRVVDHAQHGRPGIITADPGSLAGVKWEPVTWKKEEDKKVVYRRDRVGTKETLVRLGTLSDDDKVRDNRRIVGTYRKSGLFPEVVAYFYQQVANIWKLDNDFAAHFASWAFKQDYRDLKVILAAFMLVQSRSGQPIFGADGKVEFYDDDHRAVGEAMCLLMDKKNRLDPKLLARVGEILRMPQVVKINHDLGFGKSARNPILGRYPQTIQKWLLHRERNLPLLQGLVGAGFKTTVTELASKSRYKPETPAFFKVLRWKQLQTEEGHRELAIGEAVTAAETWEGLTEREVCERIVETKPGWKKIVGLIPSNLGLTAAIMAAAVESGCLSDQDLVILTPTLEDLGLLAVDSVKNRHAAALAKATNQRAANVARRVRKVETAEILNKAADDATKKALEEVTKNLRVYFFVDVSGSMNISIERAKGYLKKLLAGFDLDRLHVAVFNTVGRVVELKSTSAAAVDLAFRGISAGGGTVHEQAVKAVSRLMPKEDEDVLFIWVGDEGQYTSASLVHTIQLEKFAPVAFGLLKVPGENGTIVQDTAKALNIPCFMIDEAMFSDPYSVTRTLRNLIATTPVVKAAQRANAPARKTLVEEILSTPLLVPPIAFL